MSVCSFCHGRAAVLRAGRLALCPACLEALCAASPEEKRYAWFQRAVRRELFEAGGLSAR